MRVLKVLILLLITLIMSNKNLHALHLKEIPNEIIIAIKTGNSDLLSKYIGSNIELTINSKDEIYSKNQAVLILKNFFSKNNPTSFKILHKGGSETSKYAIGNLMTSNGNYRITILVKSGSNTNPYIHQLRIEKE